MLVTIFYVLTYNFTDAPTVREAGLTNENEKRSRRPSRTLISNLIFFSQYGTKKGVFLSIRHIYDCLSSNSDKFQFVTTDDAPAASTASGNTISLTCDITLTAIL